MRYPHLIHSRLLGTPLLILPEKLRTICSVLELDLPGERLFFEAEQARDRKMLRVVDGVAIIDVYGTLIHRPLGLEALSGLTSYEDLRGELQQAVSRADVETILFDFDSPGGEAAGCYDLADEIFAARSSKRVVGIANDLACSAAYMLFAACGESYVTQSATGGSVGVRSLHVDQSQADAEKGLRITEITSGAHKADGTPHSPLTEQAHAAYQDRADEMRDLFVGAVARYRGVDQAVIRATEARTYLGQGVVAAGLADDVRTFDELLLELTTTQREEPLTVADSTDDMTDEQLAAHLATSRPGVVASIRRAEATRLEGIRAATLPGHEKLVAAMMAKTADLQPGDVALAIVQAEKTKLDNRSTILDIEERQLEGLRAALTEGDPAPPVGRKKASGAATFEQKVDAAWESGEHAADFDSKELLAAYASAHPEILEGKA